MIYIKAKDLKNKGVKFELGGATYELRFDMNTFCTLEEVYSDVNEAFKELENKKVKAIRALIYAAVKNENEDVTLKEVGRMLTIEDIERISIKINEALDLSMPEVDEKN